MSHAVSVLVVDDDRIIRECVVAFLEDEGFTVSAAASAEEGLELLKTTPPDVCITDLRLPAMNGRQFIVAGHLLSPHTGFLIHTGSVFIITDDLAAVGLAQEDVLNKPIHDMAHLTSCIMKKGSSSGS